MRGQTKIAVAVGAVLIIAGIWYSGLGDKPSANDPVATHAPVADEPQGAQPMPGVTLADRDQDLSSPPPSVFDPAVHSSGVASPAPRHIEGAASALPGGSGVRPQPVETQEPVPAMLPTELPGERAGLSTVLPNVSTTALEKTVADPAGEDVPRNADKDLKPATPALPPIAPVVVAKTGTSTTRPAGGSPPSASITDKPAVSAARSIPQPLPPIVSADDTAAAGDKSAEKPKPREHVVQSGETFTSIAVKHLGHAKYANLIMKANPGKDPRKLYVGTKLIIPESPTNAASATGKTEAAEVTTASTAKASGKEPQKETYVVPPADPSRSYTVQPGEGWYDLARKFMGDGKNYPELYEYNKERVGGDPHLLRAGTVIELPPNAKLPPKAPPPATPPAK